MKKWIALILALVMCLALCSCGKQSEAAKSVDDLIKSIGDVTLDSKSDIVRAEHALNALGEEDYNQVKKTKTLEEAREAYDQLVIKDEAAKVESAINSIGVVTLNSKKSIEDARAAYKRASEEAKNAVGNLVVLETAEAELQALYITEAEKQIDAIGEVTLDSRQSIADARATYDSISKDAQNEVRNAAALEAAEAELQVLLVEETERLIGEIGKVTIDSSEKIQAAMEMYNSLSGEEKALVSNSDTLESARENYKQVELLAKIEQQEVHVISTKYIIQDYRYKTLYPDALQAVIQNNSSADIKDAVVAFVAWDKNNLPVKIKGDIDFSDGSYIRRVGYNDINLVPGSTYGKGTGFEIDDGLGIKTFKAIVVSYETFEGDTWENPLYSAWRDLYEGVKLK